MSNDTGGKKHHTLYPVSCIKIMANICVPLLHAKYAPEPVISGMINNIRTASLDSVYLDARAELEGEVDD
jgi:hypothetical protein